METRSEKLDVCVCLFVCLCMQPMLCRFVYVRLNEDSSLAKIYFHFVQFPVQLLIFRVHMNQFGVTTNETHATQMRASTLICMATLSIPTPSGCGIVYLTSSISLAGLSQRKGGGMAKMDHLSI